MALTLSLIVSIAVSTFAKKVLKSDDVGTLP
jgi:hypothetical protein